MKSGVKTVVNTVDINRLRLDKDIYINLLNKYKNKIENAHANERIKIISQCKNCNEYNLLTSEEQDKLFMELMSIDKRFK